MRKRVKRKPKIGMLILKDIIENILFYVKKQTHFRAG